jgi:hypothetical protein
MGLLFLTLLFLGLIFIAKDHGVDAKSKPSSLIPGWKRYLRNFDVSMIGERFFGGVSKTGEDDDKFDNLLYSASSIRKLAKIEAAFIPQVDKKIAELDNLVKILEA